MVDASRRWVAGDRITGEALVAVTNHLGQGIAGAARATFPLAAATSIQGDTRTG